MPAAPSFTFCHSMCSNQEFLNQGCFPQLLLELVWVSPNYSFVKKIMKGKNIIYIFLKNIIMYIFPVLLYMALWLSNPSECAHLAGVRDAAGEGGWVGVRHN